MIAEEKALKAAKEQFEINDLLPEQENSLREFLKGQNIFENFADAKHWVSVRGPLPETLSLLQTCLIISFLVLNNAIKGNVYILLLSRIKNKKKTVNVQIS